MGKCRAGTGFNMMYAVGACCAQTVKMRMGMVIVMTGADKVVAQPCRCQQCVGDAALVAIVTMMVRLMVRGRYAEKAVKDVRVVVMGHNGMDQYRDTGQQKE